MRRVLLVVGLLSVVPIVVHAQTVCGTPTTACVLNAGARPIIQWDHDGVNVTDFKIYSQPATATGTQSRTLLATVPAAIAAGSQEFTFTTALTTAGSFKLTVTAFNRGTAGVTSDTESAPSIAQPYTVVIPPMPAPNVPTNLRFVIRVVASSDGSLHFELVSADAIAATK